MLEHRVALLDLKLQEEGAFSIKRSKRNVNVQAPDNVRTGCVSIVSVSSQGLVWVVRRARLRGNVHP